MYIIWAVLAFGALIIVHELGHFILAKINGVKVIEFSMGMGPEIFSIKGKETSYALRVLPFGGAVRMLGEEDESKDLGAFNNKSAAQRLSIIAAGPLMNFLTSIILFAVVAFNQGYYFPIVDRVDENMPASIVGIQKNDKIIEVNHKRIKTWFQLVNEIEISGGKTIQMTVNRDGTIKEFHITPVKYSKENRLIVGIVPTYIKNPSMFQSINQGFAETDFLIRETFRFLGNMFVDKSSIKNVGGPISVIRISGKAAQQGKLAEFSAFIGVQLAIFNIIPFPALDGGWIFLLIIEMITGRKMDSQKVGTINFVGFVILMTLMVVVTLKDILLPVVF